MQAKYEIVKKDGTEITVKAVVGTEEFENALTKAYNKNKSKYRVDGFRVGKAPRKVIEKHYGEGVFYEDAVNILLPEHYSKAIKELDIKPVARPDVDVEKLGAGEEFIFTAVITIAPEFELDGYKGVEVESIDTTVTDELIMQDLEKSQKQNARITNIDDRAAQLEDTVNIDFSGKIDGVVFEGGTAEGHSLKLGSGHFIPGFEDQLVGCNVGDEVVVKVKFPEDYHSDELKGKDAEFDVKINSITKETLPEIDDEFAKDISEFDTLDELKESIRKELSEKVEKEAQNAIRDRVVEKVTELLNVEIPKKMHEAETEEMIYDFEKRLSQQGLSLEQYASFMGGMDSFKEQMSKDAMTRIKTSLVIEKIIEKEGIEATQEDVDMELDKYAQLQGIDIDKIRAMFQTENYEYLKSTIATRKAVDMLVENAVIKDKE